MSSAQSFLYLDDDGAVQGPFAGAELLGWFADGYFQANTLLLPASADTDTQKVERSAFKPFATFFPHTQLQQQLDQAASKQDAAQTTTEPAVIVEDEEDEMPDAKPVAPTADVVPEAAAATTAAVDSAPAAASASDAPAADSAAPAAPIAPVVAPVTAQSDWFYLDDTSLERGPFPASDMAAWFTAGFFTAATKVRTAAEKECKAFGERSEEQESFMKPSQAAAAAAVPAASTDGSAAAAAVVNIEDQFETDMMDDEEDEEEGDEEEAADDTEQKTTDKLDASDEKKSAPVASEAAAAPPPAAKVIPPALLPWFYVDASGKEQGPFTPASMLKWHRANFFAFNDSPLRRMDEESATPLSKRTAAPSFFSAILPRPPVARENRWYYLDARETEQGPFTETQMRGWWLGGFLKPSLRVRQVGEDEGAFKEISERKGEQECAFTKGANPAPLLPTPGAQTTSMMPQQQQQQQQQQPQSQYPMPYIQPQHPHPHHPHHPPAPYGYPAPPSDPYWGGSVAPHPYAYAGHNPYGGPYAAGPSAYGAPYGAPPPPPPPRDRSWNASGDYAQSAAFSGHRGRGRHVVGGAYAEPRLAHDPMSTYAHPAALEAWQEDRNKRPRR